MSTIEIAGLRYIGPDSAGLRMTPEEFDAIDEFDANLCYELVDGVVVVNPPPSDAQADPNDILGYFLHHYRFTHVNGSVLSKTSTERYVRVRNGRRIADRLIWVGFESRPVSNYDTPTIAIEFVSPGKRNHERDYVAKSNEYLDAGVLEYWIFDRFTESMTIHRRSDSGVETTLLDRNAICRTGLLPGFEFPVAAVIDEANAAAEAELKKKQEEKQE